MQNKSDTDESKALKNMVVQGIKEKKGMDIVSLNMEKVAGAVCSYFVICHGTNRNQVEAIADSVVEEVRKKTGAKPWHKEGFENAEWILLDYVDVVVHIFLERTRVFFDLEKLWADAELKKYSD